MKEGLRGGADFLSRMFVWRLNSVTFQNKKIMSVRNIMKNRVTVTALTLVANFLPLNSILREERYGEPGSGKLGILRDLNCFLGGSTIDKRLRSIVPRRSVFKLKAFG